jgi:hypothetical protein
VRSEINDKLIKVTLNIDSGTQVVKGLPKGYRVEVSLTRYIEPYHRCENYDRCTRECLRKSIMRMRGAWLEPCCWEGGIQGSKMVVHEITS